MASRSYADVVKDVTSPLQPPDDKPQNILVFAPLKTGFELSIEVQNGKSFPLQVAHEFSQELAMYRCEIPVGHSKKYNCFISVKFNSLSWKMFVKLTTANQERENLPHSLNFTQSNHCFILFKGTSNLKLDIPANNLANKAYVYTIQYLISSEITHQDGILFYQALIQSCTPSQQVVLPVKKLIDIVDKSKEQLLAYILCVSTDTIPNCIKDNEKQVLHFLAQFKDPTEETLDQLIKSTIIKLIDKFPKHPFNTWFNSMIFIKKLYPDWKVEQNFKLEPQFWKQCQSCDFCLKPVDIEPLKELEEAAIQKELLLLLLRACKSFTCAMKVVTLAEIVMEKNTFFEEFHKFF